MGRPLNTNTKHTSRIYNTQIKFLQINLMHSRVATSNLLEMADEDGTDVVCIQEPYVINNKIACIPKYLKIYATG